MTALPDTFAEERSWAETARLYVDVTRPKVMALVVFTAVPALALGESGWPTLGKAFWVLFATALAGAASSAFNAYYERETDALMARTRRRPLPSAILMPRTVLAYGWVTTVVSTALLWVVGGPVAALVGLGTIAFYVGVYTLWLKPRTPQNIVIGGAAGATAPLIASAAMTGEISLGAWILFGIIFLWTPPHFWAIAIFRRSDYARAGFPMMNLVVGDQPTRWRSLGYTLLLVPFTLLPVWFGFLGALYGVAAAVLGAWFGWRVVRSLIDQSPAEDWKVFKSSTVYLMLLFLAMIVDLA